jgi:hypothetical protein
MTIFVHELDQHRYSIILEIPVDNASSDMPRDEAGGIRLVAWLFLDTTQRFPAKALASEAPIHHVIYFVSQLN